MTDQPHIHIVSPRVLLTVFGALMVFTVLTVAVTYVDLGPGNILLALGIAVAKAALVAMYFMHLRWDSPFYGILLIVALSFVMLFVGLTVLDTSQNLPLVE
jgi:cytochrome c oxidase subunit IV